MIENLILSMDEAWISWPGRGQSVEIYGARDDLSLHASYDVPEALLEQVRFVDSGDATATMSGSHVCHVWDGRPLWVGESGLWLDDDTALPTVTFRASAELTGRFWCLALTANHGLPDSYSDEAVLPFVLQDLTGQLRPTDLLAFAKAQVWAAHSKVLKWREAAAALDEANNRASR